MIQETHRTLIDVTRALPLRHYHRRAAQATPNPVGNTNTGPARADANDSNLPIQFQSQAPREGSGKSTAGSRARTQKAGRRLPRSIPGEGTNGHGGSASPATRWLEGTRRNRSHRPAPVDRSGDAGPAPPPAGQDPHPRATPAPRMTRTTGIAISPRISADR